MGTVTYMIDSDTKDKKSKILFIGANDLLVPAINFIAGKYQVSVCESGKFNRDISKFVQMVTLQKSFFFIEKIFKTEAPLPFYFLKLGTFLRKEKPDIIIVMDWIRLWYWQTLIYKFKNPNTKIIVYSETQKVPKNFFKRVIFKIFLVFYKYTEKHISSYWVYTTLGKDYALNNNFRTKPKLIVVPVNTNHFTERKNEACEPKTVFLKVLMNARYVSYKRHIDLLQAVRELRAREKNCYVTFISRDATAVEYIKSMVQEYGLESRVKFRGAITFKDLPALYHEHDILILPSDNEPIGMVVPEAMACGLPTITSDTVGANVYVQDGVTGLIFPTGNSKVLAEKLEFFFEVNHVKTMGKAARSHIEKFSIDAMSEVFYEALEPLTKY